MSNVINNTAISRIKEAYEIQDVLVGNISYIGNTYLIVKVFGYPCIMPSNEVEVFPVRDFNIYMNNDIVVKVISIEKNQNEGFQIKVSHRAVVDEILEQNHVSCYEDVKKNTLYKGVVKKIKDVGVFVSIGKVDGLIPKSRLPIGFYETSDNYFQIGTIVDINVIFKEDEKQRLAFSIPSIDPLNADRTSKDLIPFERFKKSLQPNHTILRGRVVYIEKECVSLHVDFENSKFTVYIKKDDLAWEKVQNSADVVFLGEELDIRYLGYTDGKLYFDLKWLQKDIYPEYLFCKDTEELLSSMNVYENLFVGKLSVIKNKTPNGDLETTGGFVYNLMSVGELDKSNLLIDPYTGTSIIAYLPLKYAYSLEDGKYYKFSLNAAPVEKRVKEHRPYMFSAVLEYANEVPDPYKEQVEKSFKENKTPKSNRELAKNIKEFGADMYSDRDRMFYELLQNADDSSSLRGVKVMVQVKDNYLIFTHDGMPFSRQDFRAIVSTANSTKKLDRKKTGYKGIGFKSVFTDSEKVYIKTGGFFFVFDRNSELFKNFRKFYTYVNPLYNEEQLKIFFEDNVEYEEEFEQTEHLPWQILPFWVQECPDELRGTTFMRNCNVAIALELDATAEKYREMIKGIIRQPRFMLFLRNTQRIQLEEPIEDVLSSKKWDIISIAKNTDSDNNIVSLKNSFGNAEEEVSYIVREVSDINVSNETFVECNIPLRKECKEISGREKWFLYHIVNENSIPITSIPERIIAADTTSISYAFMLNDKCEVVPIPDKTPSLYAFLPMEDRRYLFPFYINADFELSSNRQEAKKSVWNEFIFYNIGKNIISWVASVASQKHPNYLSLLPNVFFTEELEESKVDQLAIQFNRGYKESLSNVPFILNDKEEIVRQLDIVIDESGFASIIGANDFCKLYGVTKRLVSKYINIKPLNNTAIFSEIEHIQTSNIVEYILDGKNSFTILRYWLSISNDLRISLLSHIVEIPGNKKNLDSHLCDIPAYTSHGKLYTFNKLLNSNTVILRTEIIKGIEHVLEKLGFEITDEEEITHVFHKKIEKEISAYNVHLFDIVTDKTKSNANKLTAQEKACLFLHFSSNKMGFKNEDLCAWELFSNQNGEIMPVSELTHMDSSLYNDITKKYVINEVEYMSVGKNLDRYLMKEKDQFYKIVIDDWDLLVTEVGNNSEKAKSLYSLVSTTYTVAEHEQAGDQNINPLCKKNCVFVSNEMHKLEDVIISAKIAKNECVVPIVEFLTGKLVPNIETIDAVSKAPFNCAEQHLSELNIHSDKVISLEQINQLLEYSYIENDAIFNRYYLIKAEDGYRFESIAKGQYIAYTDNEDLSTFVKLNCKNIILLLNEFSKHKNNIGILTEDELLLKLLELIGDTKPYAEQLLPIYRNSISPIKTAYIDHLSSIEMDENSFIEDSDINLQTLLMCSTIEKQEDALFNALRAKMFIVLDEVTHALSSIKLQHTIEVDNLKFPLSKLVPNEDKVAILVDSLKERLQEKSLVQNFIDRLLGNEVDKGRADDIFEVLNKRDMILENGVQLAFIIKYLESKKMINPVFCKVLDAATDPRSHNIQSYWFLNSEEFIDSNHLLAYKYQDISKYISIPYKNEELGCVIKKDIDDFQFIKDTLSEEDTTTLLNYVFKLYEEGVKLFDGDIQHIKNSLKIDNKEYVVSSNYCLPSEVLPIIIERWRISSNTERKNIFLKNVFNIHFDDSDIVKVRKYLTDGTSFSLNTKSEITSKMTCNWIYEKSIKLNNIQFSTIIDIVNDKDYTCEIAKEELSKFISSEYRYTVFGDYYIYFYEGEIPWNVKLTETGYIFHFYQEKDIILDGYNIFVNHNEKHRILDLLRSLINTDEFTAEDFMCFFDQEQARISGTLDGEIDEDPDEEARKAANQLAKQEAIEWLTSKGYDTTKVSTNYSFIEGISKDSKMYNIVVKSFRLSSRELKINPNEWLYLLKPNSRLMLYMGHMSFAVVDRKSLIGNHDFLRLRISSSNFSVDNNKLEENLERLARDIQYFERTHFVFERVHDNILSRANSLEDYGLFKSNSNQEYSAGNEEDIE